MKTRIIFTLTLLGFLSLPILAQTSGYQVGDEAMEFNLQNVEGSSVSLDDPEYAKGVIVIFTCNTCPYAVAYQDRMIALHEKYASQGYPVIAINPNDAAVSPGDSFEEMKKRAAEKDFPYSYVYDKSQEVIKAYGGSRTPHVYLLNKENGKFIVKYIGAIDNNHQDASAVTEHYVEDAVDAVIQGEKVALDNTKTIGCSIKWSKKGE